MRAAVAVGVGVAVYSESEPTHSDLENLVDYMILHIYAGAGHGFPLSPRRRNPRSGAVSIRSLFPFGSS